jgi:UDP-N-acetylmuramate--alanine ligase
VSAIAKLLRSLGVTVSGSDLTVNEQTAELVAQGVSIKIGHAAEHVPAEAQAIVFSSAAASSNPERVEGVRRGLPSFNSHQFLGLLAEHMKQIVITGTHGKSTTTAMMALVAEVCGTDPTVVVGTRVPQLALGNMRIGASDWLIAEGDEFDHHFLAYKPTVLVINNIEGDHFDVYPTLEAMIVAYDQLLNQVVDRGWIIANGDDPEVVALLKRRKNDLAARKIKIRLVGVAERSDIHLTQRVIKAGQQLITLHAQVSGSATLALTIPGAMNAMNAAMCYAVAEVLDWSSDQAVKALAGFRGIWRRLEKIDERNGITVFSDYGHHPTAVQKTLEAVKEFYPDRRLVVCFQPHHRNRTKHLFSEFVTCFELADELILAEVYDVKGRDQKEDSAVSSVDLVQAIQLRNAKRDIAQFVAFAAQPQAALEMLRTQAKMGDVVIIMGAGDIYKIAPQVISV